MGLLAKLKNSFRQSTINKDALDELAWHLEQRTQEYTNQGMPLEEARTAARKRLGNLTGLEEDTAESDLIVWLEYSSSITNAAARTHCDGHRSPFVSLGNRREHGGVHTDETGGA
jgi:hypothetical protein